VCVCEPSHRRAVVAVLNCSIRVVDGYHFGNRADADVNSSHSIKLNVGPLFDCHFLTRISICIFAFMLGLDAHTNIYRTCGSMKVICVSPLNKKMQGRQSSLFVVFLHYTSRVVVIVVISVITLHDIKFRYGQVFVIPQRIQTPPAIESLI
jgi:hypothetical protein